MSWTEILGESVQVAALACARGVYQRNLVLGCEALSGSTLRGKAARYIGRYHTSRDNLLCRLRKAGLHVDERQGPHNRRILVIASALYPIELLRVATEALAWHAMHPERPEALRRASPFEAVTRKALPRSGFSRGLDATSRVTTSEERATVDSNE